MNSRETVALPDMRESDFDLIRLYELPCRCCGKPVRMFWQNNWRGDGFGTVQVDCQNPECKPWNGGLYTVTRDIRNWLSDELAREWKFVQLPAWKVPEGLQAILSYIARRDGVKEGACNGI